MKDSEDIERAKEICLIRKEREKDGRREMGIERKEGRIEKERERETGSFFIYFFSIVSYSESLVKRY